MQGEGLFLSWKYIKSLELCLTLNKDIAKVNETPSIPTRDYQLKIFKRGNKRLEKIISFPDLLWTKPKARSGQIRFALRDHLSGM